MSLTVEASTIDQINAALKTFEKTQSQYRSFGANDTEPDSIFQKLLLDALEGKEPKIPRSGESWELYASSMDCDEAASALHDHALAVVKLIENCRVKEVERVSRLIKEHCWRYT